MKFFLLSLCFFNQQEKTWRKCSVKTAGGGGFFLFLLITSLTYFLFIILISHFPNDIWGTAKLIVHGMKYFFFSKSSLDIFELQNPLYKLRALLNLAVHPGTSVSQSQSDGSFTKHCRSRSWRAAGRRRRGKTWRRSHCRIYFETPPWEQKKTKTHMSHWGARFNNFLPPRDSRVAVNLTSGGGGREERQTGPPSPWGWTQWGRQKSQTWARGIKPRRGCSSGGRCASPLSRAPRTALLGQREERSPRAHQHTMPLTALNTEITHTASWNLKNKAF